MSDDFTDDDDLADREVERPSRDIIDLEPDWSEMAEAFDERATEARRDGREFAHAVWTELAVAAENSEMTKEQVYYWAGVTQIDEDEARKRLQGGVSDDG